MHAVGGFAQPHDRPVPKLPFYLPESQSQRLFLVRHVLLASSPGCHMPVFSSYHTRIRGLSGGC